MEILETYERHNIRGVEAIVWKHHSSDGSSKEGKSAKERKKLRDQVGKENINLPMLDMRKNKQGNLEFNNILMTVDNTEAWVDAFNEFFGTECVPVKDVSGGTQYLMRMDDEIFFTTTFYPNTCSCMLQPANNDQDILLQALQIIPDVKNIKEEIQNKNKEEEDKTKKSVHR